MFPECSLNMLEGGYNEDVTAQCVDAVVKESNVP
jgi:hypothetical protein